MVSVVEPMVQLGLGMGMVTSKKLISCNMEII
jgi:hypothetical protein